MENQEENIYIMMNKPEGYVCSAVSDSHATVYELLSPELQQLVQTPKRGHRLHSVGRLDCNTSGLLLFTTDGHFSHNLTAPDQHVTKTYIAKLKFPGNPDYVKKAAEGLILPAEKKAPEQKSSPTELVQLGSPDLWQVTIAEGKFHQVRRIFLALGNEVVGLERIAIGKWKLEENLKQGEYKFFTP